MAQGLIELGYNEEVHQEIPSGFQDIESQAFSQERPPHVHGPTTTVEAALYCLARLRKLVRIGPRNAVPSVKEIRAVQVLKPQL